MPSTEKGGVYFFLPDDDLGRKRKYKKKRAVTPPVEDEAAEDVKKKEFALIEIFNYYSRRDNDKPAANFDQMHTNLFTLNLKGYITFLNDM